MAPSALKLLPSRKMKKKETKNNKKKVKEQSLLKNKMGQEIEEIFRANKKKRNEPEGPPGHSGECSIKEKMGVEKEEERVNKKKKVKHEKMNKTTGFDMDVISENRSQRRTADGFALYSAEELGIGNPDAGNTPLCPFDCSCCF